MSSFHPGVAVVTVAVAIIISLYIQEAQGRPHGELATYVFRHCLL
jgi:hypothetical protein